MLNPSQRLIGKFTVRHLSVLVLGLCVFLTDNSNLTSASSFETAVPVKAHRKHKLRLPDSVAAKSTLEFDCRSTQEEVVINTEQETVRLQANNCPEKTIVENTQLKNKLVTFPVGNKSFSSEFAYLVRGENKFLISSGKKLIRVSIFRY